MTNKIGIDVTANFDPSSIKVGIDQINQSINQANQQQINPVSDKSIRQLDELNRKFQQLLKVDGELRRRLKVTGQSGALFENIDWGATHPDAGARARKMAAINNYLGIGGAGGSGGAPPPGHPPVPPAAPTPPPRPPGGNGLGGGALNVVQAGLRGAGSAGSVAAGALGAGVNAGGAGGLSTGIGAGLGGLVGGLLALGIGKIVSGVMEKIGQAEDNNVEYDKLKRTLGDVNIEFGSLKEVVTGGAEALKVTYGEFSALSLQYARAGNMQAGQYKSLGNEVGAGVGLSRGFGLDPSKGVGILGQMRGLGVTSNTSETRRFALLIGETIGRSKAFAKADEVFDALGEYAASQTRHNMSAANVSGFAGMFSSMVGSGIPGLDPAGASSILGRVNAALSNGGARGEASQFFTARVGDRMGLNPLQTQVMREGGAFATNDNMFGKGSAYARYMGRSGPGGGSTFLDQTRSLLEQQYGGDSEGQKLMRAQAFANHTGINMNQSMAMLSLKPNQMGEMQKYAGDITKLNAGGIGNMSKVLYGSDADRQGVTESLMRRKDLSQNDKESLAGLKDKDVETQKNILTALVAQHDQERTTGTDIRDSKNALDNIKVSLADKLVPLTLEMRQGIMAIAGVGKGTTSEDIMRKVVEADSEGRRRSIEGRFTPEAGNLSERQNELEQRRRSLDPVALAMTYRDKPEILEQKLKERSLVEAELTVINKRLATLSTEKADLLKKENERKNKELADVRTGIESRWAEDEASAAARGNGIGGGGAGAGGGGGSGGAGGPLDPKKRDEAMKFFMGKGWSKEQAAGIVANLGAESKLNEGITGDNGMAYGIAQWHPDRQRAFAAKYGKNIKGSSYQEQLEFVNHELTAGNEQDAGRLLKQAGTAGQAGSIVSRYYERPKDSAGAAAARASAAEALAKSHGTPMPAGAGAGQADAQKVNVTADPIVVRHENAAGQPVAPQQTIQTRVTPAKPFGGPR